MNKWHGGKGSRRRPQKISDKKMQENWDHIFRKKDSKDNKNTKKD